MVRAADNASNLPATSWNNSRPAGTRCLSVLFLEEACEMTTAVGFHLTAQVLDVRLDSYEESSRCTALCFDALNVTSQA